MEHTQEQDLIPHKQYSKKECTAEDRSSNKILQTGISLQKCQHMAIVLADAEIFYNYIHQALITLMLLCLGV